MVLSVLGKCNEDPYANRRYVHFISGTADLLKLSANAFSLQDSMLVTRESTIPGC
jgi:hypothetical protein